MAQRKTTSPSSKRPATGKPGAGRPGAGKPGAAKAAAATKSLSKGSPPKKKPGKSIVNQKQTPWGLIVTTVVIVVFAVGIVVFAVANHKSTPAANGGCSTYVGKKKDQNKTGFLNELQCAKAIKGVTFTSISDRNHVNGVIKYNTSPPDGGNHSPIWADCSGTVYPKAIANENAVHMLEHGAVWITYNPKTLPSAQLATLTKLVSGVDRMALSPYASLKTNISLQAWGYQLFVNKASDPRIAKFISALRFNQKTTPELGVSCVDSYFLQHISTPGHPLDA